MPIYEYRCNRCNEEWELLKSISTRRDVHCNCGVKADLLISSPARPIILEYYSENLNDVVTGPEQKKRLMKEKGLEEA